VHGRARCVRRREYKHTFAMHAAVSAAPDLLDAALATTEFLVVDTETNGLGGDRCEVTEIGAVLVKRCREASSASPA
jgi:DNA polymerase-3 subunit epsilon